jgi:CBS domain-containing protein
MKIEDVMSTSLEVVAPDTSIQEAADRMRALDVGALPVCEAGQRLIGMVTDRDIVIRAVARGEEPGKTKTSDVMTRDLVWCYDDDSLEEVTRKMRERQVRRIPVLNRSKKLVGVVSLGDLATSSGDTTMTSRTLEHISRPAKPDAAGKEQSPKS